MIFRNLKSTWNTLLMGLIEMDTSSTQFFLVVFEFTKVKTVISTGPALVVMSRVYLPIKKMLVWQQTIICVSNLFQHQRTLDNQKGEHNEAYPLQAVRTQAGWQPVHVQDVQALRDDDLGAEVMPTETITQT